MTKSRRPRNIFEPRELPEDVNSDLGRMPRNARKFANVTLTSDLTLLRKETKNVAIACTDYVKKFATSRLVFEIANSDKLQFESRIFFLVMFAYILSEVLYLLTFIPMQVDPVWIFIALPGPVITAIAMIGYFAYVRGFSIST